MNEKGARRRRWGDADWELNLIGDLGGALESGGEVDVAFLNGADPVPLFEVGQQYSIPAGTAHAFWNAGSETARIRSCSVPALRLERFLRLVIASVNRSTPRTPSLFGLVYLIQTYEDESHYLTIAPLLQRIVFPIILTIGRVLGRYRQYDHP